jgi:glyoxylase-like metal-dependent hydrolase (beta-lactamase superfamily II)
MGLIGELARQGVKLLLVDAQKDSVHASDYIFERERLPYVPVDESQATVISCGESRAFLERLGISGEIIPTPSHSADSISLVLDDGDCFVGDLEPYEYLEAYDDNTQLQDDWARILSFHPKRVFFAHAPARENKGGHAK